VKTNYEHHKASAARTDFKEFAGRSYLLVAGEGREEVAQYIANWLDELRSSSTR
jgi:hypothetical protein